MFLAVAVNASLVVPAYANGSTPLPDPNGVTLLALGLMGLIIGRRAASKRNKD
ncbi:MAG: hypothetical protein KDE55_07415 [Novosphingobium sp.]|nr:hypothetical protein [Novosphingobium sp.]